MAARRNLRCVVVIGPPMQDRAAVEELDVTLAYAHVEIEFGRGGNARHFVQRFDVPRGHRCVAGLDRTIGVAARDVAGQLTALAREDHHLLRQWPSAVLRVQWNYPGLVDALKLVARGAADAKNTPTVFAGVSPANGR